MGVNTQHEKLRTSRLPIVGGILLIVILTLPGIVACASQGTPTQNTTPLIAEASTPAAGIVPMPFAAIAPVLAHLPSASIPRELREPRPAARDAAWHQWRLRAEEKARTRIFRGDEDSVVNLLLYGTSFTNRPRIHFAALASGFYDPALLRGRIDDLLAAARTRTTGDRVELIRDVLRRAGADLTAPEGRELAVRLLIELARRAVVEQAQFVRKINDADAAIESDAPSALYRERGLSTDASIYPNLALENALRRLKGVFRAGTVRRVGVVGPGLDVADKFAGYDVYPAQTLQPFTVIDSLRRLGLAAAGLQLLALDINPRVIAHLDAAVRGSASGYVISLPRPSSERWRPELIAYSNTVGDRIGEAAGRYDAVEGAVEIRQIRVAPDVVRAIHPYALNIVTQRLESHDGAGRDRCDLIIATNVLTYYDSFEQALASANIASMLAPGGLLLTNTPLTANDGIPLRPIGTFDVVYTARDGDRIFAYARSD